MGSCCAGYPFRVGALRIARLCSAGTLLRIKAETREVGSKCPESGGQIVWETGVPPRGKRAGDPSIGGK